MGAPIRILSIGPNERLARVTRELGARGAGILVYDRTRKLLLVSQSAAKSAAVINKLVTARLLPEWMDLHSQGIYNVLGDQIKARAHKGWYAEMVELCDMPERLAQVRRDGYSQVAIASCNPACWEIESYERDGLPPAW